MIARSRRPPLPRARRRSDLARLGAILIASSVAAIACRSTRLAAGFGSESASSDFPSNSPPISSSAFVLVAAPSAARSRDGCWGEHLDPSPPSRLAELGARCAEGLAPLFESPVVTDGPVEVPVLAKGACLRAAGVAAESGVALDIVDDAGRTRASDAGEPFALAPANGPLCPRDGTKLSIRARRLVANGPVWVQVWSSERSASSVP